MDDEDTARPLLKNSQNSIFIWVCLEDVLGSFLSLYQYGNSASIEWNIINVFSSDETSRLFVALHKNTHFTINPLGNHDVILNLSLKDTIHGMYA